MSSFWAIVKLTLRNGVRSHIFQLLLFLLLLCVVIIPGTVSGDGTASGFIRISLLYSLSAVSTVLALSSIWLGCFVMTQDVESYQLHMVVTKPVSRVRVWIAKWVGVNLIHLALLLVAALAIYGIILYKYNRQEFTPEERERIRNEVMVGRRVYWPAQPDFREISRQIVRSRIQSLQQRGLNPDTSPEAQEKMLKEARREAVSAASEARYNTPRTWTFKGIPADLDKPMYLRYRPYVGKIASEGQRVTRALWLVGVPKATTQEQANVFQSGGRGYEIFLNPLSPNPEQVMTGEFHEKTLRSEWKVVTPDNEVVVSYVNFDDSQAVHYFQPADGPKLLIEACSFFENYMRAVLVIAIELLILSGLGCAFGGFLSMPTAIFVVISYLLFGSLAAYMTGLTYLEGAADHVGQFIAKLLLCVVIPLQTFEVTGPVASGEIIELAWIWRIGWYYFLCRALPLFALGIIFYWRRELGLIIRK